jgi:hypothetical protein
VSNGPTEAVNLILEKPADSAAGSGLGQLPPTPPAALWRNSLGYRLEATDQKAPSKFGGVGPDFPADTEEMLLCLQCLMMVIINPGYLHCG